MSWESRHKMKTFRVNILGSLAALPFKGQITSLQTVRIDNSHIIIDCGEGAQMQLAKAKFPISKCEVICISHLHGDHVYGLPGLLSAMEMGQKKTKLSIIGPIGVKEFVESIRKMTSQYLSYEIDYVECEMATKIKVYEGSAYTIEAFPLNHRILTYGYIFIEKTPEINIRKEAINEFALDVSDIRKVKAGFPVIKDGKVISLQKLAMPLREPRRYVYCTDTRYDHGLAKFFTGSDVLFHEATYTSDLENQAIQRKHSTAAQAASIAKEAGVKQLVLGHFSSRYQDRSVFLEEAIPIFQNTILGNPGTIIDID